MTQLDLLERNRYLSLTHYVMSGLSVVNRSVYSGAPNLHNLVNLFGC